jgi:hypothetical protein
MICSYLAHGYLQERAFVELRFPSGYFVAAVELCAVAALTALFEWPRQVDRASTLGDAKGRTAAVFLLLSVLLVVSQGCGTAALLYTSYPVKVAFKSSKLLPGMAIGMLVTGCTYRATEYLGAFFVCISVYLFQRSEHGSTASAGPDTQLVGLLLLGAAVMAREIAIGGAPGGSAEPPWTTFIEARIGCSDCLLHP